MLSRTGRLLLDLVAVHEGGRGAARCDSRQTADWGTGLSQAVVGGAIITGYHEYLQDAKTGGTSLSSVCS